MMAAGAQVGEGRGMVEWPTLLLVLGVYAAWIALVWFHDAIALPVWLVAAVLTSALWGSVQHELIHGHPTRSRRLNAALGTPPIWLWLPYDRYRQSHLAHHRDERLTDPLDDPESRYWTAEGWRDLTPIGRALVGAQGTLAGRLLIGPFWVLWAFGRAEALLLRAGNTEAWRIWAWHALWVALLLGFAIGLAGMPVWQYLVSFAWGGTAVALIRSFAEHRAHEVTARRTAVVENSRLFGFLFLNNNLHAAHHRWPGTPWYRLPALYRRHREELLSANGGLVYDGYGDLFRRFLLRRHDQPVHPLGRVPRPGADHTNGRID